MQALLLAIAGGSVDAVMILGFRVLKAAQTGNTILLAFPFGSPGRCSLGRRPCAYTFRVTGQSISIAVVASVGIVTAFIAEMESKFPAG